MTESNPVTQMTIMLKLGGSLITDKTKPYTAQYKIIERISKEIKEAVEEKNLKLILAHGGGSFPHQSATKYRTQDGIITEESIKGIAIVQNDAAKLNRIVIDALIKAGLNAVSIQPSACIISKDSRILNWDIKRIEKLLELGIIPVPYGDVSLDENKGCSIISTEEILGHLAAKLHVNRIILAGKTNGVLTSDDDVIETITEKNFDEIKRYLGGSDSVDATGGMQNKVERMIELTRQGISSEIINGTKEGYIKSALLGRTDLGTKIY